MYLSLSNDSFAWYLNNATCISEVNLLYSYKNASLAQRLEHRICNARVVGSIPTGGFKESFRKSTLVYSMVSARRGFEPLPDILEGCCPIH